MHDPDTVRAVAARCATLARALAPYQNRGTVAVADVPAVPPSALLKEMQERVNAVRAEYGMPPQPGAAVLSTKTVTDVTNALLDATVMLAAAYPEPPPPPKEPPRE